VFDLLRGMRRIDLPTVVPGPYATQLLGDFGAEIIKVEPPAGDVFRSSRPGRAGGDGAGFLNLNRNKKSVTLDLADPAARAALLELVKTADVFVHNMRPGSARRLGIDYPAIKAANPGIVYCSARGYGEGPNGDEPAYDDCIQAASGLASINAGKDGEPRFVPSILCDKIAGLHLAFSVAAGLASRARTGEGMAIETPMYETMVSFLLLEHLGARTFPDGGGEMGYMRLFAPDRRPFRTSDGWVAMLPYTRIHWQRFLALVGRSDLVEDPLVTDAELRASRIGELYAIVAQQSPSRTTAEWLELLREAGIPCAPVRRLEDLPDDPQLVDGGMFGTIEHPAEGTLRTVRSPFGVTGRAASPDRPAPVLGADTQDVLGALPSAAD